MATLAALTRAYAAGPPAAYIVNTYAGPNLAEDVEALSANVWIDALATASDRALILGTYTDRGFIRILSAEQTLRTIAGKHARDALENEGGLALETDLIQVTGLDVDSSGTVYASLVASVICRIGSDGRIYRVAGTWDLPGFAGDGGPAIDAGLDGPHNVLLAPDGSIYVSEYTRVRRIGTDGIIQTVAGNGTSGGGGAGDGGAAIDAALVAAEGLALDAQGRLYIADLADSRVRRVELDGTITTVAGTGNRFSYSGDGGLATDAAIGEPEDVVFDDEGNFYIADGRYGVVRRVTPAGIISTYAGTGVPGYSGDGGPAAVAQLSGVVDLDFNDDGSLFLADEDLQRVRRIANNGVIETVAGNGTKLFGGDGRLLSESCYAFPRDVVFAADGSSYIADRNNNRIRSVSGAGLVSTFAGTGEDGSSGNGGAATSATMAPFSVELGPAGELFFLDQTGNSIRRIDGDGIVHAFAGSGAVGYNGDDLPAATASLGHPNDFTIAPDGTVYIADTGNHRIRYIDPDGLIQTLCGTGLPASDGDGGPASAASTLDPHCVFVTESGEVYFTEYDGNKVRRIGTDGVVATVAGTGDRGYSGDGGLATQAQLSAPFGVFVDQYGYVYFSSAGNNVVRRVSPEGVIETIAGTGETRYLGEGFPALEANLYAPWLLIPGKDDTFYLSTRFAGRIYRFDPDPGTPVAWSGLRVWSGSGRIARLAWSARSNDAVRYEVYRLAEGGWQLIGALDGSGAGTVEYSETVPSELASTAYRVDVRRDGQLVAQLGPVELRLDEVPTMSRIHLRAVPNPFNPRTSFEFTVPERARAQLRIFDAAGRLVLELADEEMHGVVQLSWDGTSSGGYQVASGVYFAELRVDGIVESRVKVTLVR